MKAKKDHHICVVGSGTRSEELLPFIRTCDMVIGVDVAAYWLLIHGIVPDCAVGDFDSASPEEQEIITDRVDRVEAYGAEKDETDMELGIQCALQYDPQRITIIGGVGSRMDHTIATIGLLEKYSTQVSDIRVVDLHNCIRILTGGSLRVQKDGYRYLSILSLTDTAVLTLKGVKYPVTKKEFVRGSSLGVSNEVQDEAKITVYTGKVLVIQSRD